MIASENHLQAINLNVAELDLTLAQIALPFLSNLLDMRSGNTDFHKWICTSLD